MNVYIEWLVDRKKRRNNEGKVIEQQRNFGNRLGTNISTIGVIEKKREDETEKKYFKKWLKIFPFYIYKTTNSKWNKHEVIHTQTYCSQNDKRQR